MFETTKISSAYCGSGLAAVSGWNRALGDERAPFLARIDMKYGIYTDTSDLQTK